MKEVKKKKLKSTR